jgi:hypothetical protein
VLVAWAPALFFLVMQGLSAAPFSGGTRAALQIYGLMGGFASLVSTPVAVILLVVFWVRIRLWLRFCLVVIGIAGIFATLVIVVAYANPFYRG